MARHDYNRVIAPKGKLPQHLAKVPTLSLAKERVILTETMKKYPEGIPDDLDVRDVPLPEEATRVPEEVLLEQSMVQPDQLLEGWMKVMREVDPERKCAPDPTIDSQHTKRLLLQGRMSNRVITSFRDGDVVSTKVT